LTADLANSNQLIHSSAQWFEINQNQITILRFPCILFRLRTAV
jgi:hypothetical protein